MKFLDANSSRLCGHSPFQVIPVSEISIAHSARVLLVILFSTCVWSRYLKRNIGAGTISGRAFAPKGNEWFSKKVSPLISACKDES